MRGRGAAAPMVWACGAVIHCGSWCPVRSSAGLHRYCRKPASYRDRRIASTMDTPVASVVTATHPMASNSSCMAVMAGCARLRDLAETGRLNRARR